MSEETESLYDVTEQDEDVFMLIVEAVDDGGFWSVYASLLMEPS